MKQILCILTLTLGLLCCNRITEKTGDHSTVSNSADGKIKLHKLEKLFVVGDFDGDRQKDTIFQHNYSRLTRTEIANSADPLQTDWNTVVKWFFDQDSDIFLTINNNKQDTLHLGA